MSIIRQNFGSFGDSANWVTDPYGNAQEKTLSAGDTSVTFDILDNTDSNCYVLCIATASAATPNTQPPKSTATVPTYGTSSISGRKTVTYPITAVTSAQAGSKCRLLMVSERSTDYSGLMIGGNDGDIEVGVEKYIGTITIDGTTYNRYKKIIIGGALPNAADSSIGSLGSSYVGILSVYGSAKQGNSNQHIPLPYCGIGSNNVLPIGVYIVNGDIHVTNNYNWSSYTSTLITVEYYR